MPVNVEGPTPIRREEIPSLGRLLNALKLGGKRMEISRLAHNDVEDVVRFLNETMPYDEFTVELLTEQTTGDPDYDDPELALVAKKENRVEGFILGICREEAGCSGMKIFSVREGTDSMDVGICLLDKLEDAFRKRGILHINVGRCPVKYLQPGVDARYTTVVSLLLKQGYQIDGTGQNMEVDLDRSDFRTEKEEVQLRKEGVIIKRLQEEDRQTYMHYLKDHWSILFYSAGMLAYNNSPISAHIAVQGERVVGYACHSVTTGHYFGPEGVIPRMQGKGIGRVLLRRCLRDIKEMGEKKAVILSVGPVYFYWKTVGARIPRLLWRMHKDLKTTTEESSPPITITMKITKKPLAATGTT